MNLNPLHRHELCVWRRGRPLGRYLPYWWPWLLALPLAWLTHLPNTQAMHFSEILIHFMWSSPLQGTKGTFLEKPFQTQRDSLGWLDLWSEHLASYQDDMCSNHLCDFMWLYHRRCFAWGFSSIFLLPEAFVTQFSFYCWFLNCSVQRAVCVGGSRT
jgi:hypothetical protein